MNRHSVPASTVRVTARLPVSSARPRRRGVRGPRARPASDKRERILTAATRTFARHGFFNAQVADVARAAGVAAGTVYLYFRGKDDLLASIFERTMRAAISEGRAALGGLDAEARLRRIARLHLERLGADRDLAVVFQIELRQTTKFMERFSATYVREYLGIIRDVIADGQARGLFRGGLNPTLAAKVLFGALDEMATNWVLSARTYDLVSDADPVVDLILHGLCAPTTTAPGRRPHSGRRRAAGR
jgi:TetR/AcrR family transcriptional regulator, fatty acid metabolism regulator protein